MDIAKTVESLLQEHRVPYAVRCHAHTWSCKETARAAEVTPNRIAKAVILTDGRDLVMAVLPGDRHIQLHALSRTLGRQLELASEAQLARVFSDCEPGAIPPIGPAYGMETVIDESLLDREEVYFVGGDHEVLVGLRGSEFRRLLGNVRSGRFSH